VRLVIHDPIEPPRLEAPTIQDAKALAEHVHDIVAETVGKLQNFKVACT
jgi:hypothetical protein